MIAPLVFFQLVKRFRDVFRLNVCTSASGRLEQMRTANASVVEVTNAKCCSAVAAATVPSW